MARHADPEGTMRCDNRIFGILHVEGPYAGLIEVRCPSKRCKDGDPNVAVVLHYFDPESRILKETVRHHYREPAALFPNTNTEGE